MNSLPQSVVFVVNPAAGGGRIGPLVTAVARRLRQAGGQAHVLATSGPGEATGLARRAAGTADLVVAVGGDGTAREVAEGCRGSGTPIAILPAGTENILGKYFGYAATAEGLWRCICEGVGHRFDMGQVNGQPFLIVAGAGFDAEVVRQLSLARKGHIDRLAYALPIWRTFWEYRFEPISVAVDGETVFAGRGIVLVGNIHRYCL
ncbi:MAG: NAD(+)/NADH kinase, partial [Phycisphaerae bacterium]|nr:NAD(+)/NADH kinase [Phycisphaerae bacterium]